MCPLAFRCGNIRKRKHLFVLQFVSEVKPVVHIRFRSVSSFDLYSRSRSIGATKLLHLEKERVAQWLSIGL